MTRPLPRAAGTIGQSCGTSRDAAHEGHAADSSAHTADPESPEKKEFDAAPAIYLIITEPAGS